MGGDDRFWSAPEDDWDAMPPPYEVRACIRLAEARRALEAGDREGARAAFVEIDLDFDRDGPVGSLARTTAVECLSLLAAGLDDDIGLRIERATTAKWRSTEMCRDAYRDARASEPHSTAEGRADG